MIIFIVHQKTLLDIVFITRCSATAIIAYKLIESLGLPYPVWAYIAGLVIVQEKLDQARITLINRVAGTIIGCVVAILIETFSLVISRGIIMQITLSAAIYGLIARWRPEFRVCMLTSPIVLITSLASTTIFIAGVDRACEVVLGSLVGTLMLIITEKIVISLSTIFPKRPTF